MECVMSKFTIIMLQQQQQQWTECVNILTVALLFNGLDTTFNMKSDDFDGNFVRHSWKIGKQNKKITRQCEDKSVWNKN